MAGQPPRPLPQAEGGTEPRLDRRLPDWEERLAAYLDAAADRAPVFGEHDCVLHGASAAAAVTGFDFAADWRGQYRGEVGAARFLRKLGFDTVEALLDAQLPRRDIAFVRRGDLVLGPEGACGVWIGGKAAFASDGLVTVPREQLTAAWSVGEP